MCITQHYSKLGIIFFSQGTIRNIQKFNLVTKVNQIRVSNLKYLHYEILQHRRI